MTAAEQALARFTPQTAWRPFYPHSGDLWDEAKVAHLYRRAAFGPAWRTIQEGLDSAPGDLVRRLIEGPAPDAASRFESEYEAIASGVAKTGNVAEAQALWCYRLLYSPYPLRERMTLFWHNHFATSNAKVGQIGLMVAQAATLRRHALAHFGTLLQEVTRDPAMLIWLDSNRNRREAPNENYARELMELFTLNAGNYSEKDIQEAARALTGWRVEAGAAFFDPARFDSGEKTIFGQRGNWTAADTVRLCLNRDECALFLTQKLFRELISESVEPSPELLAPLAGGFKARNYDIAWLVRTMLESYLFYSPAAMGQKVKSPCDFVIGTMTALEGRPGLLSVAQACDQLGQSLYHPPSVKGWEGGRAWLNSSTMLARQNLALEMTRGLGATARVDPARLAERHGVSGARELVTFFLRLFHQKAEPDHVAAMTAQLEVEEAVETAGFYSDGYSNDARARSAAHLALTLPEFQMC